MDPRLKAVLLPLCLVAALPACDSGKKAGTVGASTGSTENAPSIESSLEGFAVLPPRIRWSVATSLPPTQVREVHFGVDRDRWWVDRSPPYTYGPEGAYLPTRWVSGLGEGDTHLFRAKVIATNGEEWKKVVRARTPAAKLARHAPGNFGRHYLGGYFGLYGFGRLSAADVADPPLGTLIFPSYTGRLVFIGASLFSGDGRHDYGWEISSDSKRVYLETPIYLLGPGGPAAASWYGYRKLNTVLCAPDGPPATYAWSVTQGRLLSQSTGHHSRYLHLRAVSEPCEKRRRLLEGVWDEIQD